jgi:hypothetical protein
MITAKLLEDLCQRGVTLVAEGNRLRYRPKEAVSPELKSLLAQHKAELLTLLKDNASESLPFPTPVSALRHALRQWYDLMAQEADGHLLTPEETRALLSEIRRLWDDVGPAFAESIHRQEAREHYQRTGRCPFCGQRGIFHDPSLGGEAAQ